MNTGSRHPTSPHLQIYRLPFTALLSITHRATGVILAVAAFLLILVLAALAGGAETYTPVQVLLQSWFGQICLFAITFALYFHFCNGIRHLFWDVGMGFELETADRTARMVVVIAAILTVGTWVIAAGVA